MDQEIETVGVVGFVHFQGVAALVAITKTGSPMELTKKLESNSQPNSNRFDGIQEYSAAFEKAKIRGT